MPASVVFQLSDSLSASVHGCFLARIFRHPIAILSYSHLHTVLVNLMFVLLSVYVYQCMVHCPISIRYKPTYCHHSMMLDTARFIFVIGPHFVAVVFWRSPLSDVIVPACSFGSWLCVLLLYPRKRYETHCTGGWVGPRTGLDGCWKISPLPGLRNQNRPARSESLHRLC